MNETKASEKITDRAAWRDFKDKLFYQARRLLRPARATAVPGMGANPVPAGDGADFRVWAPHAERVFVMGDFNDWSPWRHPLAAEADGLWSARVAEAAPGGRYKFLIHNGKQTLARTDPYARAVAGPQRDGVICDNGFAWEMPAEAPPFQTPALHELVIYELHVGTFAEQPQNVVGAFRDVIAKLPYLQDLGVNAIELMPVAEFAGDYSWGYNTAFPFAVTETYGGRKGLQKLVQAAHAHGIAVIVDVVYNHFGPQDLSLWRFDGWHQDGKGGIYFYNDWRSKTPWADTRPDYGRSQVRQFIYDNVFMWLDDFHVDGLRWDATSYIRNAHGHDGDNGADIAEGWELMRWINREAAARHPGTLRIAEDLQRNAWITRQDEEGAGFDAQWDDAFVHPIRQAIITPHDEERDMTAVRAALAFNYNDDPWQRVIYTESHDEVANGKARVPEEITPGDAASYFAKKRSTLGAALVFTAPGAPMIFQGQEFLEDKWFDDRAPLDWGKAARHAGILALYRRLIRLRRNLDGHSRGLLGPHINVHHVNDEEKVIAFHRWQQGGPGDDVIVVANFANQTHSGYTLGFPQAGLWRVRLNGDDPRYDAGFGGHFCPDVIAAPPRAGNPLVDEMPYWGNVALAPYTFLILSQGE